MVYLEEESKKIYTVEMKNTSCIFKVNFFFKVKSRLFLDIAETKVKHLQHHARRSSRFLDLNRKGFKKVFGINVFVQKPE